MLSEVFLRLAGEVGPGATWLLILIAAMVATFVLYTGIALLAALCAKDPEQGKFRYGIFQDLLGLFDRRRRG
jgi:hypothetical protein